MPCTIAPTPAPLDDAALFARFQPVFDRIAEGAAAREQQRQLAHEPIRWLREAGFGALRVPRAHGGLGASVEQLFVLLVGLATADSNLTQALRAHFGFVERLLGEHTPAQAAPWLRRVADGAIMGNATTEAGETTFGQLRTRLRREADGRIRLSGEKFYSTGTLYADWIAVTARHHDDPDATAATAAAPGKGRQTIAMVRADAPGVQRVDDWRGFGQRLTASGTTRFDAVEVPEADIMTLERAGASALPALFQLFHTAALAGIARAIQRDAADYVCARKRVYSHGSGATPAEDPLVQQVVGQLDATAYIAGLAAADIARGLGDVARLRERQADVPDTLLADVDLRAARAQVVVGDAVLAAATRLFDVGGASALAEDLRLDRHWRNARTLASHNPTIYKARALGDHAINGTPPVFYWTVGVLPAGGGTGTGNA